MDRRDPRAVELAREVVAAALGERGADARAQLAGRAPRVGDDEDRVDVEPAVADRAHEALDEHRRLAGARAGGDEDLAGRLDGCAAAARSCARHPADRPEVAPRPGTRRPSGRARRRRARMRCRERARRLARAVDRAPERLLLEVVVPRVALERVALARAQQAARLALAGERPVERRRAARARRGRAARACRAGSAAAARSRSRARECACLPDL